MIIKSITDDITVLLERALLGKTLAAFGEDGCGKHGKSDVAKFYSVNSVEVMFDMDADGAYLCQAYIVLDNYDSNEFGDICTDENFMISLRKALIEESIDPDSVSYELIDFQCQDSVCIKIDADLLLQWA